MLVANWICSYVLKDMLAIHQNGTRITNRKITRPIAVRILSARITPPIPEQVPGDEGDADDEHRHQEDRDGHAAPPAELVEGDLVRVRREDLRGRAGAAAGHHVDDVEVVDGEDEAQQGGDGD